MNNTNRLISGDNKGYASMLFEMAMNPNEVNGHVSNMHSLVTFDVIMRSHVTTMSRVPSG